MIKEWEYSAKILIYHYRVILKGMTPFASTWNDKHERELRKNCHLDDHAIKYVRSLAEIIKSRGEQYRFDKRWQSPSSRGTDDLETELRDACQRDLDNSSAKPLVWISQLYMDDVE
jgi:hypothetical protein